MRSTHSLDIKNIQHAEKTKAEHNPVSLITKNVLRHDDWLQRSQCLGA